MNIAFDPWIPCIGLNGTACRISLFQCLSDESIADLAVRPHQRVALMRLLLCISYAALGIPKDDTAWNTCRQRLPESASHYLAQWRDSFELFHQEKPFLQIPGLRGAGKSKTRGTAAGTSIEAEGLTPTSKLDFALATGNNSTLFDHEALNPHRSMPPEKLALNLLTFQMFSPGGLIGSVIWNGETTPRNSADAPCIPGSMLHTTLRGDNLPQTVWLNLLSADRLQDWKTACGDNWMGRPVWEAFPSGLHDEERVRNATRTFLGRMVPLSRAILLQEDGASMLLGNGLTYPVFSSVNQGFPPEPSATVFMRKGKKDAKERSLMGIVPERSLWRQLHAITAQRHANGPGGCLALARLHDNGIMDIDIVAGGLARDQANIVDETESVFHVPAALISAEGRDFYADELQRAEDMEQRALAFAMERRRAVLDGGWTTRLKLAGGKRGEECAKLRAHAVRDYWTAVERNLPLLSAALDAVGTNALAARREEWRKMLRSSALNAYATVCRGDGKRELWAFVTGQKALFAMSNKILELRKEEKTDDSHGVFAEKQ